jgi:hypothetical protein
MGPEARAYLRDLPDAELNLLEDAGHWLLETHFDAALPLIRRFLAKVLSEPALASPPGAAHDVSFSLRY